MEMLSLILAAYFIGILVATIGFIILYIHDDIERTSISYFYNLQPFRKVKMARRILFWPYFLVRWVIGNGNTKW